MTELQIPIDLLRWGLALLPILVLMVLMVVLRWTAPQAGMLGMFTAAGVALFIFRTPLETLAVGGAKGVWDAVFILYVVWPALATPASSCRTAAVSSRWTKTTRTTWSRRKIPSIPSFLLSP